MLPQLVAVIKEFKSTGQKGPDTGMREGVHIAARDLVAEILKEDEELRNAMKDYLRSSLSNFLQDSNRPGSSPTFPSDGSHDDWMP